MPLTDTTFAVGKGAVLDVTVTSSKVTVRAWERSAMQVRTNGDLAGADVALSGLGVRIDTRENGRRRGRGDVGDLEILVPRGTRVVVSSREGDVVVAGVGGGLNASVINGNLTVRGGAERTWLSVASGDVVATDMAGPVQVESISGSIALADVRGDVEVSGTSSDVTLTRVRAERVTVEVVSGDVSWRGGPMVTDGRYEFSTHSGDVRLDVADSARAVLDLQTFQGTLHTKLPVLAGGSAARPPVNAVRGAGARVRLPGAGNVQRVELGGGGGAHIVVTTFSGDVYLDRSKGR